MIDTMVYVKSALIGSHHSGTPLIESQMDQKFGRITDVMGMMWQH